ncbi:CBS domain-containing protein [Kibdelosporangium philippinense]|uniref:CBS domain-containing protein n=1 Tax=Kibdelosporangium philippinense TaxID=211113 RepID=A0ABS8ZDS6_9PSEU|nr:CBS domain-containing protein [Kibdelosporangium philippinense]MCE7004653.1 CBS domain-containing protein [Kibdelosporangium philippinense]
MRTLKVLDVMTRDVTTVREDTPYKEIVTKLVNSEVSGLPVLSPTGVVVGVVSEGDLLFNEGSAGKHERWHDVLHPSQAHKADGRVARDLMSQPAVTTQPNTPVRKAAALLARNGYKRLPVVDAVGRLLGIVSRRDVLGAFLRADHDIANEVKHEVLLRTMSIDPATVDVDVKDGVVTLSGRLERKSHVTVVESLTHAIDGVVDVVNELTFETDDESVRLVDPVDGTQLRDLW